MAGNIFVLNGDEITEMQEALFEDEDTFQRLIAQHPSILAGEQINPDAPRKLILIARELGVPADMDGYDKWSLDHLFADQDAIPTFVEVKRSTDTRLRREVVAQMLDYAANGMAYWSMDKLRLSFEKTGGSLSAFGITESDDEEAYWQQFAENLRNGKLRLLFVADAIPKELRRIIEFLNEQMKNTEVLGVEIKQYKSEGSLSTLVPRIVGQTAAAMDAKGSNKPEKIKWNEEMFLQEAEKISTESADICRNILQVIKKMNPRVLYSETTAGSAFGGGVIFYHGALNIINVHTYKYKVGVVIPFGNMVSQPIFGTEEKQLELIAKFNSIPGIYIDQAKVKKYPSIDVLLLQEPSVFNAFINVIEDIVHEHEQLQG